MKFYALFKLLVFSLEQLTALLNVVPEQSYETLKFEKN